MALDRLCDRIQQVLVDEGLGQELHGSCFHRAYRGPNIAMPRDEHDGNFEADLGHPRLEIQPAQARQPDIEHQAAGTSAHERAMNSCAEAKVSTFSPADLIKPARACRMEASSSTTNTVASG